MNLIWPQIFTTIFGFLVAVFILRRYAWGPLLQMLEERRAKIQGEFDRIEVEKQGAAALKSEYEGQLRGIDAQARARIQEGIQEGQRVGGEIKEQARVEARSQMERARDEIEREKDKANVALRNSMVDMVVKATESLIREKLDDAGHRRLITDFLGSMDTLDSGRGTSR